MSPLRRAASAALLLSLGACQTMGGPGGVPDEDPPGAPPGTPPEVLVGAGDIASCAVEGDEATAALLDGVAGTVFTLGDNAYPDGTAQDFERCYAPSWGRHRQRTRPTPGNHEYHSAKAGPYFDYFGTAAGEPGKGYYSYELGAWHVVVLNSELELGAGSVQEQWLRADLKASTKRCTLAYWHRPLFSSGPDRDTTDVKPLWTALYEAGAEVVLGGHDHLYERFAPQTPEGKADPERGIRQFVVGTGGMTLYPFGAPLANSERRDASTLGVLKLTLEDGAYAWEFLSVRGGVTDQGRGTCHE
ncbi:metallophosphoesterase family protein [Archangium sp.]|uniref:metallophosphoesterase family protein n=1 Tax=Archangium sp. TaxID=1872627 RepID=UPI002EDB4AE3